MKTGNVTTVFESAHVTTISRRSKAMTLGQRVFESICHRGNCPLPLTGVRGIGGAKIWGSGQAVGESDANDKCERRDGARFQASEVDVGMEGGEDSEKPRQGLPFSGK